MLASMGVSSRQAVVLGAAPLLVACARAAAPPSVSPIPPDSPNWSTTPAPSPEQRIIDHSADAVAVLRANIPAGFSERWLERARGVMVFPEIGGAAITSGKGVLLAHQSDGTWSAPAFYSLQSESASLSNLASNVALLLVFTDASTLNSAIWGLAIGTSNSVARDVSGSGRTGVSSKAKRSIYGFVTDGRRVWSVPVDGMQVSPFEKFDRAYYGPRATTYAIVMDHSYYRLGKGALRRALTVRPMRD